MAERPGATSALAVLLPHKSPNVVAAALRALHTLRGEDLSAKVTVIALDDPEVAKEKKKYLSVMAERRRALPRDILIADYRADRLIEVDADGKEVTSIEVLGIWDAEKLANGNLLIVELSASSVSEVDPKNGNKIVWSYEKLNRPFDADRLPNGNTLIADTMQGRVIEVDKTGKIVWSYAKGGRPHDADRLANGNTLIADAQGGRVIEVDKAGKIVWQLAKVPGVYDADRLPNGNTLVTIRMRNEVREVDAKGETVWILKGLRSPGDADRLPNGLTAVAERGFVKIYSPDGKAIWKKKVNWAVSINLVPKVR